MPQIIGKWRDRLRTLDVEGFNVRIKRRKSRLIYLAVKLKPFNKNTPKLIKQFWINKHKLTNVGAHIIPKKKELKMTTRLNQKRLYKISFNHA